MIKVKTLYQTLQDRGNPEYIEINGPFHCKWSNTWLGHGYYFWDTFIENAHWWGEVRYQKNHVICEAKCDFDSTICFDLVGDTEHMLDFEKSIEFLKSKRLVNDNTTVSRILEFIKKNIPAFNYHAIRVYGIKSISEHKDEYNQYKHRLIFELSKPQYLDYKPAIQICVYSKPGVKLRDFKIVFPDEYNQEYVI